MPSMQDAPHPPHSPDAGEPNGEPVNEHFEKAKAEAQRYYDEAQAKAEAATEQAKQQVGEGIEQAKRQLAEATAGIEDYVKREPVKALAVAAGVGLVLGVILKR